jgi:hypothetical protein
VETCLDAYSDEDDDVNSLHNFINDDEDGAACFSDTVNSDEELFCDNEIEGLEQLIDDLDNNYHIQQQGLEKQSYMSLVRFRNYLVKVRDEYMRYTSMFPVFGFNSSRYDLNLIKEILFSYILNYLGDEPEVIKKANQFVLLRFSNLQFLDILNFLGGCSSLDNFLKAYNACDTKGFFPYEWLDSFEKLNVSELPPIDAFYSNLRSCNPLEEEYKQYQKLINSGNSMEASLKKLRLNQPPLTKEENYSYLQKMWIDNRMKSMRDFLEWYNNKDVIPTLNAMTNMVKFYHDKGIDVLKLGYTLPNIANKILHGSTDAKFYPFHQRDEDWTHKIRQNVVGGPSIVFTRYAKAQETKIRLEGSETCKTILGVDASQLYPYSMTQPMPCNAYTRWDFNAECNIFVRKTDWRS